MVLNFKGDEPDLFSEYTKSQRDAFGWFMFYVGCLVSALVLGGLLGFLKYVS